VNSLPIKASTPDNNNEGVNIPLPALVEHVISLVATTLVCNRVMNLWSAARVVEESSRQEEAIHIEGTINATPPIPPPCSIARTENVEYNLDLPL